MRTLVIGSSGYIGPAVLAELKNAYPEMYLAGVDAGWFLSQMDGNARAPEVLLNTFHQKDVRDLTTSDLEGYEHVIYLAAISNDPMGDRFAELTKVINHASAIRIASEAKYLGTKTFTFASSASVYGAAGSAPRTESSPMEPISAYARSKAHAEKDLMLLADQNFTVTCLRFATACGWSPRLRLDLVVNDFVASALTSQKISILSDGTPWRPLIATTDMARAISWSLSSDRTKAEPAVIVNVGSDSWNFQVLEIAEAVAQVLGNIAIEVASDAAPDRRSYRVDFTRWREIAPQHQPVVEFKELIRELGSNMKAIPDLATDFRNSHRIRLHKLLQMQSCGDLDDDLRWKVRQELR